MTAAARSAPLETLASLPGNLVGNPSQKKRHPHLSLLGLNIAKRLSFLFGALIAGLATIVMLGWFSHVPELLTSLPGYVGMKANTALCFLLGGIAVMSLKNKRVPLISLFCSVAVLLIAALNVLEFVSHHSFGIDELLIIDRSSSAFPGMMAPLAAVNLCVAACSLICLSMRAPRVVLAQLIALLAGMSSLFAMLGYMLGVPSLYDATPYSSIALQSAAALFTFSLSIFFSHPDSGIMTLFWSETSGGVVARRLIPMAVAVPIVLAGFFVRDNFNFGEIKLGVALIVICNVLLFVILVWWLALFLDRSEKQKLQLERLSQIDPLTGVFNRRFCDQRLDEEVKRCQRFQTSFSLIVIDIDHFKHINDSHGHLAGDSALCEVARLLKSCLRDVDSLCRFGGEEFVVLAVGTNIAAAAILAERLRCAVAQGEFPDIGKLTISIGIAEYPLHGDEVSTLIGAADAAMYQAKSQGRNRVSISLAA